MPREKVLTLIIFRFAISHFTKDANSEKCLYNAGYVRRTAVADCKL